jgi:hypothetical protein
MPTAVREEPTLQDAIVDVLREALALDGTVDVATHRLADGRLLVSVALSVSPDEAFGEVAILLRTVEARIRHFAPEVDLVCVQPRAVVPSWESRPATETIVLVSSD